MSKQPGSRNRKAWKKVPICEDRSGPVVDIKVSPQFGNAARAAKTIEIIAQGLLKDGATKQWVKASAGILTSKHSSVVA